MTMLTGPLRLVACALLAIALAACAIKSDPRDDAAARKAYAQLAAGDDAALTSSMPSELMNADTPATLDQMRAIIPRGEKPTSVRAVSWNHSISTGRPEQGVVVHEYAYADRVVIATTTLAYPSPDAPPQLIGLNVNTATKAQIAATELTFEGKGPVHYGVAAAGAAILLTILAALVKAVRTPGVKRRWLWIIFILVGVGQFSFNWATGQVGFQPLMFSLLGLGITKLGSSMAPWIVSLGFPLGAVWFLLKRRPAPAPARTAPPGS